MMTARSVGVIGLGLIGGSIARELSGRGVRVHAFDHDEVALRDALDEGIIEAVLSPSLDDAASLDAVVIALPVSSAVELIERTRGPLSSVPLVTDVCSTKRTIMRTAIRAGLSNRFIGGHPVAGDHRCGWSASRTGLFRDARVYMCVTPDTDARALEALTALWDQLGATCEIIDPAVHDRLLAWSSHLPQAASTALARVLARAGVPDERLGPGGRDMTRLARGSADVWTPIAMDNSAALCAALAQLESELAGLREALVREDRSAVHRYFEQAGQLHGSAEMPSETRA